MKLAFMSLKFHEGEEDKRKVDEITAALKKADIDNVVMVRDVEKYGEVKLPKGANLMRDYAFPAMEKCDMLIVEFSEKGVGLGIGAGYAAKLGIPIYVIAKTGSDISSTMRDVSSKIIFYDKPSDLTEEFKKIGKLPTIILASKSAIRKKMLVDSNLPFVVRVSNADETPDSSKCYEDQLAEISLRKAMKVFKETSDRGPRIIVSADQNIFFNGVMYGKPKNIAEARDVIKSMMGRDDVFAYTGNTVIYADHNLPRKVICETDIARMELAEVSDEELEEYLKTQNPLAKCAGINLTETPFLHLAEGKLSTASGMTIEYLHDMLSSL